MGKFAVALLFALSVVVRPIAAAPIFHAAAVLDSTCVASTNSNAITTSGINATGATLLLGVAAYYSAGGGTISPPTQVSDSGANTWNQRTNYDASGALAGSSIRWFYAENPGTVGSGQTLTIGYNSSFPGICFLAISGTLTASVYSSEAGQGLGTEATSIAPGSVTPTQAGDLVVSAASFAGVVTSIAVNSSFTQLAASPVISAGNSFGIAAGYLVAPSTSAVDPTWTGTAPLYRSGANAVFVTSGGGGATINPAAINGLLRAGGLFHDPRR